MDRMGDRAVIGRATLIVLPGDAQHAVAWLAREHAAFDPLRRAVVHGELSGQSLISDAVAVMLRNDGTIVEVFTASNAFNEASIEDAFVRATRLAR
jgi:hypothetical protein